MGSISRMSQYLELLALIAPVFAIIAAGTGLRWRGILTPEAEHGIVGLVVKFLYPCLIIQALLRADNVRASPDVLLAPVVGFASITVGFLVCWLLGRALGLKRGKGLRTFSFSAGIFNYGYIPIPLIQSMYGDNELAALFIHNVGVEFAIWTVGIAMLAGQSLREGLRKIVNPMVIALFVGLALNASGVRDSIPGLFTSVLGMLAACAIPLGLLAIGANLYEYLNTNESVWDAKDCLGGVLARLGILPALALLVVWLVPFSIELKRVLIIQAAMPAGIMPIVLAKHYGGQPIVAVRVVFATTLAGMLAMPLWIRLGQSLLL